MTVIRPQWVGRNIGHDDRLFPINGGAARPRARSSFHPVNGLAVFLRKTGGSAISQSNAVSLKKKNRAQHSAVILFDVSTQSVQYFRQWTLAHDHRQYPFIQQRQGLGGSQLLGG